MTCKIAGCARQSQLSHPLTSGGSLALFAEVRDSRGEPKTGNKAWLRRRLHAAIVRAHLEVCDMEDEV